MLQMNLMAIQESGVGVGMEDGLCVRSTQSVLQCSRNTGRRAFQRFAEREGLQVQGLCLVNGLHRAKLERITNNLHTETSKNHLKWMKTCPCPLRSHAKPFPFVQMLDFLV